MINFKTLNCDRVGGRYHASKAPHKAVLLLAVIKLFENKKINLRDFELNNLQLIEIYKDIWGTLNYDKPGPISNPLYHLKSDGFYRIHFLTDRPTKPGASLKKLLEQANTAEFDDEFIRLISDEAGRKKAVEDILTGGYFTKEEIFRLNGKLNIIDKSFEYEEILESSLSRDFQLAPFITEEYDNDIIRKGSFRRLVIGAYDSTCAVCQSHLIIADTSIIDAAHILPFAKFKNDDPRNGVSLCKNHHWLFDNGAITISQDYRIRVSPNIMEESPEGFLSQYLNRKIMLPKSEEFYPAKEALMWHSRKWKHT